MAGLSTAPLIRRRPHYTNMQSSEPANHCKLLISLITFPGQKQPSRVSCRPGHLPVSGNSAEGSGEQSCLWGGQHHESSEEGCRDSQKLMDGPFEPADPGGFPFCCGKKMGQPHLYTGVFISCEDTGSCDESSGWRCCLPGDALYRSSCPFQCFIYFFFLPR